MRYMSTLFLTIILMLHLSKIHKLSFLYNHTNMTMCLMNRLLVKNREFSIKTYSTSLGNGDESRDGEAYNEGERQHGENIIKMEI